jgi:hypothetical protein
VVLVPPGFFGRLDAAATSDVLVHECAHHLHRDPLVALLQRLAGVLLWPHPLVHALNRALGRAREEVCDNHVLAEAPPPRYARALLALACGDAAPAGASAPALVHPRWRLRDRIAGMLHARRTLATRAGRLGSALAVVLLAASLAAGAALAEERRPDPSAARAIDAARRDAGRVMATMVVGTLRGIDADTLGLSEAELAEVERRLGEGIASALAESGAPPPDSVLATVSEPVVVVDREVGVGDVLDLLRLLPSWTSR